jgi:tetratricopeptide (TPR) repeat protein
MKKGLSALSLITLASVSIAWSQAVTPFSVTAVPTLDFPIGIALEGAGGTSLYGLGYGVSLRGQYALPFLPALSAGAVLDVDFLTINGSDKSSSFIGGSGELAYTLSLAPRLGLRAGARGGVYRAAFEGESFVQPYAAASLDLGYILGPSLSLGIGASYKAYLPFGEVFNGVAAQVGIQYNIGSSGRVAKIEPRVRQIFPLFYSYYDKNPVGAVVVRNRGSRPLEDLSVSFFVPQYMEAPKECWASASLAAGGEAEAPVYALFKDSIFSVTEATKVAGEIRLSYSYLGKTAVEKAPITVTINNRNGMTWDDTRKIAAFVTSMDPSVRGFSLPTAAMARGRSPNAVSANFRIALAVFDALKAHGVGYVADPVAPIESRMAAKDAVDYLQFPVQTLAYRGGDCDDISILFSALLESAGVASAFLTIPGHVFVAFDLGMTTGDAAGFFKDPGASVIDRGGQAWLPVEITRVQDGFVKAYQAGAQEWLAAAGSGKADFTPVREAWAEFAPANTGTLVKDAPPSPDAAKVQGLFDAEMARFFAVELQSKISELKAEISKGKDVARLRNRLGAAYARFGMLTEAKREFEAAAAAKDGGAAVASAANVNLGNIAYLGGKYQEAYEYYLKAVGLKSDNAVAVLGLARAAYELGKKPETDSAMSDLKRLSPMQADKYAYMSPGGSAAARAASAEKEVTSWPE